MKMKLFALALAASMTAGAAYAQTQTDANPTQEGGSEAAAGETQRGTPLLPEDQMAGFWTDSTMTTMRSDAEITTMWSGMSAEDQTTFREYCEEETLATQRDLPESTIAVCERVRGM